MKMIRHQHKVVKQICFSPVRDKDLEEKPCPRFRSEQMAAFPCLRCNEVGLTVSCRVLAQRFQKYSSAAKAVVSLRPIGTTQVVPFQNSMLPPIKAKGLTEFLLARHNSRARFLACTGT